MDKFGYTVPTTWQQWAAIGAEGRHRASRLHHRQHRRLVQRTGRTCGPTSARSEPGVAQNDSVRINSTDSHCTRMASLLDPLIKNGDAPAENIFTPAFAKKYGGADRRS